MPRREKDTPIVDDESAAERPRGGADSERTLRAREELLTILAHDLRGPLSTISLAATSLKADDDPATLKRKWGVVERAARRMTRLVEDLLDVTRIETGSLVLDLASQQASLLLREVVAQLEPTALEASVQLTMSVREDFSVHCAFERIVQVIANLTSNALDVTPAHRGVRLLAELRGELAWFAVEDDGPGIAAEHLAHIFERGWRMDAGRQQGAGLGLAIARGIVEAHGGRLGVESRVGSGTRFHFELPRRGPPRTSWCLDPSRAAGERG